MGGRGSVSKRKRRFPNIEKTKEKQKEKKEKKIGGLRKEVEDFLKKQINFDVSPNIDPFFEQHFHKRNSIHINWEKISRNDRFNIMDLANKTKKGYGNIELDVRHSGAAVKEITFKRRK